MQVTVLVSGNKPVYCHENDAGFDIQSNITTSLLPGEYKKIPTGTKLLIPNGYEVQIRPRSGLAANKGIGILNAPGTIDPGFTGEICIVLINHSNLEYTIHKGDRIAQGILSKTYRAIFKEEIIDNNGRDGFGSTGI